MCQVSMLPFGGEALHQKKMYYFPLFCVRKHLFFFTFSVFYLSIEFSAAFFPCLLPWKQHPLIHATDIKTGGGGEFARVFVFSFDIGKGETFSFKLPPNPAPDGSVPSGNHPRFPASERSQGKQALLKPSFASLVRNNHEANKPTA